jgi:adenylate cyclase
VKALTRPARSANAIPGPGSCLPSQYEDPEYAVSLLAEGSAGYGYLLKDHVAEGSQLVDAIRTVATGGTALDPSIVHALIAPVAAGGLLPAEEDLLGMAANGKTIKAIAASRRIPAGGGRRRGRRGLRQAGAGCFRGQPERAAAAPHAAPGDRRPGGQGETLSRLLPSGLAEKLRRERRGIGETERVVVTVLMSDIRSYSAIAEHADPSQLAGQLNTHRAAMNQAILGQGGTVMQFVGDAVMAVFGAPFPQQDRADRAVAAALVMHSLQADINRRWLDCGLPGFGLGLGLSTGEAAAALLGSAERLEYTLVGYTVNLSQRLQQLAEPGETVLSDATIQALGTQVPAVALGAQLVKGRDNPVIAYKSPHHANLMGAAAVPAARSADSADAGGDGGAGASVTTRSAGQ